MAVAPLQVTLDDDLTALAVTRAMSMFKEDIEAMDNIGPEARGAISKLIERAVEDSVRWALNHHRIVEE